MYSYGFKLTSLAPVGGNSRAGDVMYLLDDDGNYLIDDDGNFLVADLIGE